MVPHRFNATQAALFTSLIFSVVTLSMGMPNHNKRHLLQTNDPENASIKSETTFSASDTMNGMIRSVPKVEDTHKTIGGMPKFQLSTVSELGHPTNYEQLWDQPTADGKVNTSPVPILQWDHGILSDMSPEHTNGPYRPQDFTSEVTSKKAPRVMPRAALPPFPPIGGNIREGETTPSRGRSGSPRRIENFPPLQNQPGLEYEQAISRRTVVPLAPSTTTAIPPAITKFSNSTNVTKDVTVPPETERSTWNSTEDTSSRSPVESNRRMDVDTPPVDTVGVRTLTTMESAPDIGTAFSLNEDFTDVHLTMKIANKDSNETEFTTATSSTAPSAVLTTTIRENAITTESSNGEQASLNKSLGTAPKFTTSTSKPLLTIPAITETTTTKGTTATTARNETKSANGTETLTTTTASTTAHQVTAQSTTTPRTSSPMTTTTSEPSTSTTTPKPTTNKPSLRRRLPSFRSTSPRPTIRRRLPRPTTTTTTTPRPRTTTTSQASHDDEVNFMDEAIDEQDPTPPFILPPEPATTRRQYVMTVPPLFDFEKPHGDHLSENDNSGDSFAEATQVSAPSDHGGIIPEGATNAIIISGIIGGCAIVFFAFLMIFCMWRQHVSRRPIYPPPDSSNSSSTSSNFHGKLG